MAASGKMRPSRREQRARKGGGMWLMMEGTEVLLLARRRSGGEITFSLVEIMELDLGHSESSGHLYMHRHLE